MLVSVVVSGLCRSLLINLQGPTTLDRGWWDHGLSSFRMTELLSLPAATTSVNHLLYGQTSAMGATLVEHLDPRKPGRDLSRVRIKA